MDGDGTPISKSKRAGESVMIFSGIGLGTGLVVGVVRLPKRSRKIVLRQAVIELVSLVSLVLLAWYLGKWVFERGGDPLLATAGWSFVALGFFVVYLQNLDGMTALRSVVRQVQAKLPSHVSRFSSRSPETQKGTLEFLLIQMAGEVIKAEVKFDGPDWQNQERKHCKALLNDFYRECVLGGFLEDTGVGQFYPKKK